MIPEAALVSFVAALISMMNPIGNTSVFAGLTADRQQDAPRIAMATFIAVTITLLLVTWAGSVLLKFFGITVDSIRAAGGLVVLVIGLHMLFNKADHKSSPTEIADAGARESIAVVPLAIPLVAGPGSMVTVLVATQQNPSALSKIEISLVVILLAALTGLLFRFATPIAQSLGEAGMGVVTRVMGLVLVAIAMGMLAEGLGGLLPGLAGQI